ncbi:coiled-coil domain-containing protein 137 isoform X3 [Narcine bancroftii]|uniref:coiled-coil domain-containing protein 137 isoform X3 n=1 Tax=Narcine bancroftii TaxID=1343680 RepID=UPI0038313BA2
MGKLEAVKPASLGPKNKRQRKQKSNMKPKNIDEQEIPFKLREIMRSKDEIKKPKRNRKTGPKRKFVSGASGPHGQIQALKFKRKKQESVQNYIQRIEQETNYVMFLSKHQLPRCPEMEDKKKEKESCMKSTPEKKKESDKRLRRLAHKKIERKKMQLEKERFTGNEETQRLLMLEANKKLLNQLGRTTVHLISQHESRRQDDGAQNKYHEQTRFIQHSGAMKRNQNRIGYHGSEGQNPPITGGFSVRGS